MSFISSLRTLRLLTGAAAVLVLSKAVTAQELEPVYKSGGTSFWLSMEAGTQVVGEWNAFWGLSGIFNPGHRFEPTRHWYEAYAKPGVRFRQEASESITLYGGASIIASYTLRKDIFDTGDTGRALPEQAYAGITFSPAGAGLELDVSAGQQEYRIGSGMLIANGAGNGFERGAVIFSPRRAWALATVAKATMGPVSIDAFYLDPNELASNDTKTKLAGAKIEYSTAKDQFVGLAAFRAVKSEAPYIQAPFGGVGIPSFILDGRDGLETLHAYGRVNPLSGALPGFWIAVDAALQRNDRINMSAWAARVEMGNLFADVPWAPIVSWSYQTFSGDNPNTRTLERFDPLFYDGSPAGWVSGSNGSLVFINSNVNAHKLTLRLTPTQQDIVTLRYMHVRANELNSPIQFGQATRLASSGGAPILVTGVPKPHLSDDFLAEYTRVLTPNAYLSFGVAYSIPGSGLELLSPTRRLSNWSGAFANLVVRH
ncbi:MAG: alginate export family protein [Beijerinckiaceae bacterium]|nr:alginate export family protein [Beijerinckiaceae bacterium]